jgi:hypothetical protein
VITLPDITNPGMNQWYMHDPSSLCFVCSLFIGIFPFDLNKCVLLEPHVLVDGWGLAGAGQLWPSHN